MVMVQRARAAKMPTRATMTRAALSATIVIASTRVRDWTAMANVCRVLIAVANAAANYDMMVVECVVAIRQHARVVWTARRAISTLRRALQGHLGLVSILWRPIWTVRVNALVRWTALEFAVAKANEIDVAFAMAMGAHALLDLRINQRWRRLCPQLRVAHILTHAITMPWR